MPMNVMRKILLLIALFTFTLSFRVILAQTNLLDTLTTVNNVRLISYSNGIFSAGMKIDSTLAKHGSYSQIFWVNRLVPDSANYKEYTATFLMKLKKRIAVRGNLQTFHANSVSEPYKKTGVAFLGVAFGNKGMKSDFAIGTMPSVGTPPSSIWMRGEFVTSLITNLDSVDCIYLRLSGIYKNTRINLDYIAFVANPSTIVYDVLNDFEAGLIVGVEKDNIKLPTGFKLHQNYPNPFNPETTIRYSIPVVVANFASPTRHVTLKVFDILGNEVATLVDEYKQAGTYATTFNARHLERSREIPSGIYFYRLQSGSYSQTKKLILVK